MRTLSILLLFVSLSTVSCRKKYCWACHVSTIDTTLVPRSYGYIQVTTHDSLAVVCDIDKKEIRYYEARNSRSSHLHRRTVTCTRQ